MKNSFKLGFLALAITMSVAACNSNKTSTSADSTTVSTDTTSTMMDSTKTDSAAAGTAMGADTAKKM